MALLQAQNKLATLERGFEQCFALILRFGQWVPISGADAIRLEQYLASFLRSAISK
jgi:hypothetical protein